MSSYSLLIYDSQFGYSIFQIDENKYLFLFLPCINFGNLIFLKYYDEGSSYFLENQNWFIFIAKKGKVAHILSDSDKTKLKKQKYYQRVEKRKF